MRVLGSGFLISGVQISSLGSEIRCLVSVLSSCVESLCGVVFLHRKTTNL